jgi:nitrate/nitrite transport system ATP-binding protein
LNEIKSFRVMKKFIQLSGVSKGFGLGMQRTNVLKDINLEIKEGEFVAIVGYSGTGKTTLISMIAGLLAPDTGIITFKDQPIKEPDPGRALVFQNYSLLPWMNVRENIALAVDAVFPDWTLGKREEHINKYISMVNLSAAALKKPSELSGGMRQRVALARALAMDPSVLLLDEPLGALDALTRGNLQEEIARIWSENRKTVVMITNDVDEGILLADRIIPLTRGPNATLGPSIKVEIDRPRDRKALNKIDEYQALRKRIIDFLMCKDSKTKKTTISRTFTLPNILPEDLNQAGTFRFSHKRPVRIAELKQESLEVEI